MNKIFFAPWYQGKEFAPNIRGSTVESYLSKMHKHQELASIEYPPQVMLQTHLCPCLFFIICGCEAFDIRPKVILTGNRHPFVTSGEHLRSIGRYMRSKVPLISVRGQKIFCWKLGRSCYFGSNGPICTFSFSFLYSALFRFF